MSGAGCYIKNVWETHIKTLWDPEVAAEYLQEAIKSGDKAVMQVALRNIAVAYDVELEGRVSALRGYVTHFADPTEPVCFVGYDG